MMSCRLTHPMQVISGYVLWCSLRVTVGVSYIAKLLSVNWGCRVIRLPVFDRQGQGKAAVTTEVQPHVSYSYLNRIPTATRIPDRRYNRICPPIAENGWKTAASRT
jgi:hypothetical protein